MNIKLFKGPGSSYVKQFRAVRNKLAELIFAQSSTMVRKNSFHRQQKQLMKQRSSQTGFRILHGYLGEAIQRTQVNLAFFLIHPDAKSYIGCLKTSLVMDNNLQAKVIGTVIALFSWLAFIVLYLAFFAESLDFWQKMAVFIASGSVLICIVAVMWIRWAMK